LQGSASAEEINFQAHPALREFPRGLIEKEIAELENKGVPVYSRPGRTIQA